MGVSFVALYHRVYNFIVKCLATYATKSVTLGHGRGPESAQLPSSTTDQPKHATATATVQETSSEEPCFPEQDPAVCVGEQVQEMGNEQINEDEAAAAAAAAEAEAHSQAQPPKKMVSINETVEEIAPMKKNKKKKGTKRMGSFDEETEPKPLKSILKLGSKPDENQLPSSA